MNILGKCNLKRVRKDQLLLCLLLILLCTILAGCKRTNKTLQETITNPIILPDNTDGKSPTAEPITLPKSTDSNDTTTNPDNSPNTEEIVYNNGGNFVEYKGNTYYREYSEKDFEQTGIFGTYEPIQGSIKNMIRMDERGNKQAIFTDNGQGPIYIVKDRMYLERLEKDYTKTIYSVDFDGRNERIIGTGWLGGIDETTNTIICNLVDKNNTYQLFRINGLTGEAKQFDLTVPCGEFLAIHDSVVYYSGIVDMEQSSLGKINLCSVKVDGTNEKLLVDTEPNLYEEVYATSTVIPCIQFCGDFIYFSYGGYAGTGNFYQGGRIARVKLDGSEFMIIAGNKEEQNLDEAYTVYTEANFHVAMDQGLGTLYYPSFTDFETTYAIDLSSLQRRESDYIVQPEGKPFVTKGGLYVYEEALANMTTLVSNIDYTKLNLKGKPDLEETINIERCGEYVYYTMQASMEEEEASIGWRTGYKRLKTMVLRQKIGSEGAEELFSY